MPAADAHRRHNARMIDLYCERVDAGLWAEPWNASTNLAFFVAALFAWQLARSRDALWPGTRLLLVLMLAIGSGSFLFHTLANRWAMLADVIPILLFQLAYLWIYSRRVIGHGRWGATAAVGGLLVLMLASMPLLGYANGSPAYLPALLTLLLLGIVQYRHAHEGRGLLLLASAVFVPSLALRSVDLMACEQLAGGTHFGWHLLNGLVLYLAMRALILAAASRRTR